jgi:hypothetical protein
MATTGVNGWRFPSYSDSPDVPRDLGILGTDIAAFIAANPGPQGLTGPSNTLSVAATNTLNAGQSASVTISGTSPTQSLTFNIPRGQDGILGGPGPSNILSIGTVDSGLTASATITGSSPSQILNLILPKGDKGEPGTPGTNGTNGAKGDTGERGLQGFPAATIAISPTVTTGAAGSQAAVTNSGTANDVVLNFTIPRGADGAPGAAGAPGATGATGPSPSIDPIATRISLVATATSSTGVNSSWYPFVTNSFSLGLLGPINSGPDNVTRGWKNIYLNSAATVISDQRTKENILPSDLGLSFINSLEPVKYNKIDGNRTHYGLIAQQVKSVLDQANVSDFGGWVISDIADPEGQQALRYEEFISPLIKAVQELTARVKSLEEK